MESKYKNKKVVLNGITFDSRKEARRYGELLLMEKAGEICDLRRQVKYVLIPKQAGERECSYYADFVYFDKTKNEEIVEDVKGVMTDAYKIKRKLLLYRYGIRIHQT